MPWNRYYRYSITLNVQRFWLSLLKEFKRNGWFHVSLVYFSFINKARLMTNKTIWVFWKVAKISYMYFTCLTAYCYSSLQSHLYTGFFFCFFFFFFFLLLHVFTIYIHLTTIGFIGYYNNQNKSNVYTYLVNNWKITNIYNIFLIHNTVSVEKTYYKKGTKRTNTNT